MNNLRRTAAWLPALAFLGSLAFGLFLWGAAAVIYEIFPYRYINKAAAAIDSIGKIDKTDWPLHVIHLLPQDAVIDPVQSFGPGAEDQLIVMTGDFFYRPDLCPEFGCLAWIMDRTGKVLHTWEADPRVLFPREKLGDFAGARKPQNFSVQGTELAPNGDLVVVFQGFNVFPYQVGIARFGWDGSLKWIRLDHSHHWPTIGPNGDIYVPVGSIERGIKTVANTSEPAECKFGAFYMEGIRVLSPGGEEKKTFWLKDLIVSSDKQGLAFAVRDDCDPFHVNGVDILNQTAADRLPGTRAGDLVVSLRSSSSILVLDQDSGEILRVVMGPMVAQHSPNMSPDGEVVLFDDLGGGDSKGASRVLALDLATGSGRTVFPKDRAQPGGDLFAFEKGAVSLSADGRFGLVAETTQGRVIEFDTATGTTHWIYEAQSAMDAFLAFMKRSKEGKVMARMETTGAAYLPVTEYERLAAVH